MKYCNIALYTFIVCFSTYAFAQKFEPILDRVIKQELNLTKEEFKEKCEAQDNSIPERLDKARTLGAKIGNGLADDVVSRAKKLGKVDEEKWDELNKDRCLTNVVLQYFTKFNVDNIINQCFDEESRSEGVEKTDFTMAIFKEYCASVKKLAKEKYQESKK